EDQRHRLLERLQRQPVLLAVEVRLALEELLLHVLLERPLRRLGDVHRAGGGAVDADEGRGTVLVHVGRFHRPALSNVGPPPPYQPGMTAGPSGVWKDSRCAVRRRGDYRSRIPQPPGLTGTPVTEVRPSHRGASRLDGLMRPGSES